MSILAVCADVSTVIGLSVPATVYGSTDREHVELASLANEMAQRIAFDGHDWTKLKTIATLTGDGSATSLALPTDYQRMLKKARVWPSASPFSPLTHYADTDTWLGLQAQNVAVIGAWTLIGDEMHFLPAVPNTETVQFYYISNLIVAPATGANKTTFTVDTDTFRLDERVLKLGMIWQWKANKGQPYAEDMANFETAMAMIVGADKGSNILTMGGRRGNAWGSEYAHPGTITP